MTEIKYKSTTEATIAAAKCIAMSCVRSGTVRRLIYTATVIAASPMKGDGSVFKDVMNETCWTPLNLSIPYSNKFLKVTNYYSIFFFNIPTRLSPLFYPS